ncbi:DNA recombination protein RmuC [Pimelobacter simplex]|uniref:DNA recombination protein RmuC n=1 Tax=Nocardioides simplex TaxID=2045 RepID=UPI0021502A9A|nr:DNA recombination protein RmuC [Pimelobacter simplex]UUW88128.1 DNA recombination protein RmuC [Pimelobacter simplex]UUW97632.1 DNA recombination protein RmuC [Pimelobacter simplex]
MAVLLALLVGLLLGAGVGWLVRQATAPAAPEVAPGEAPEVVAERHEAALAQLRATHESALAALRHEVERAEIQGEAQVARARAEESAARAAVQSELTGALATVDELRVAVDEARGQYRALLDQQRQAQREREANEAGQTQVLKTLTPVVEHLRSMQQKVDDLEKARVQQHTELATQIKHTQRSVEDSRKAADTLASVLKNNAVRGAWGETQLRTLVETAGLLNRVDFELQHSVEADSGHRRPDMVINLPGGKQMAIDAKVPYNAFMDAQREGIEPETRQRLLEDHARKVRGHVDTLARKGYWTGLNVSPEFTVAFIPNEQLLNAAIDVDPSLMEHAFASGIVLATPTNLWSMLKTVAFTWKQEALTEDAQVLFELGQVLYRRILKLSEHVDKLGRSLQRSVKDYNAFTGSLERSVLPAARKLNAADPVATIEAPKEVEEVPRALTSSEFSALADLERDELTFDFEALGSDDAVDAEIVDEQTG